MIKTNKQTILTITFGIFALFFLTAGVFALVIANESPRGFTNPPGLVDNEINGPIDNYVLRGAGYFLNGYADILRFLNTMELAKLEGPRYDNLTKTINDAAANMENAYSTYTALVQEAAHTPYNPAVILKLEGFDYKGFMEKNNLNPLIFKKVVRYLNKGNIRGIYHYLDKTVESILPVLYRVKTGVQAGKFPAVPDVWMLAQTCSETLLFGQYVSQIFYEIK
ncbi:MAG TPA: hypothetical protein VK469_17435 [Candidatus Kapabacteria bacterium]|nr:hypothetical protein [Candidatus Kapabacteria bacterium]